MFKKKRRVGRPRKEEIKKRRRKKVLIIGIPSLLLLIIVALIGTGSLRKLMGASIDLGEAYCEEGYTLNEEESICTKESEPYVVGDTDNNGEVDSSDLNLLQTELNKGELSIDQYPWYDINGDGIINSNDYHAMNEVLQGTGVATSGGKLEVSGTIGISSGNVFNETVIGNKVCSKDSMLEEDKCISIRNVSYSSSTGAKKNSKPKDVVPAKKISYSAKKYKVDTKLIELKISRKIDGIRYKTGYKYTCPKGYKKQGDGSAAYCRKEIKFSCPDFSANVTYHYGSKNPNGGMKYLINNKSIVFLERNGLVYDYCFYNHI